MARDTVGDSASDKRPLVAVGYGPRCVPVMQLTEAAADMCELLWMIDGNLPEMREMTDLLHRFGPVVDIGGLSVEQLLGELSPPYQPDGIVTYLDANMTTFARVAESLALPFHSPATALALTDKAEQRRVLRTAGLPTPSSIAIAPNQTVDDLPILDSDVGWPAVLKPRSA
jgi:glutathione synthase/RimK-type ligase-like ATP-grasp enzyme